MGRDSRQLGNNEQSDKCYTPKDAMTNLFPFLDSSLTYYEATSGESTTIIEALTEGGFSVVGSGDKDFFDCGEGDIHDGVVTSSLSIAMIWVNHLHYYYLLLLSKAKSVELYLNAMASMPWYTTVEWTSLVKGVLPLV